MYDTPTSCIVVSLHVIIYYTSNPFSYIGGRVVLGAFPVPGRPINLDYSRARAYCACSRCG